MINIYKITNRLNRKLYVGQTRQTIEKRFLQHSKANSSLGNAMLDCGLENFTIEVIEECENQEQANDRERFWIKVLNCKIPNGYNRTDGGEGCGTWRRPTSDGKNKLGEFLTMYRERNGLTMQLLADACGFSKAYLSMLEKGVNPQTGKPYSPTIQTLDKIAKGAGQGIDSLLKFLDGDQPVTITTSPNNFSDEQANVLKAYDELNNDGRRDFWDYLNYLKFKYSPNVAAL